MMKAVLQRRYGAPSQALAIEDIDKPEVGPERILVRVCASSINSGDCRFVRADPIFVRFVGGFRQPKNAAFGGDVAGVVESVGADVTEFKPGDEVFGIKKGALAEFVAGPAENFTRKPANLTMEQAAAIPTAGTTALQALRDHGHVKARDRVVINGAGGGVGTYAVQIAKALGATVTAVTSTDKVALVGSLGADTVIDRGHDDYTRNAGAYDVIIDIAGDHSFRATRRALTPTGTLVVVGAHKGVLRRLLFGTLRRRLLKQNIQFFVAGVEATDFNQLGELAQAGKLRPVIDRIYTLDQTAAAVEYAEDQHVAGKVVVSVST
jgi:NADPH:quinone reductase-like Zn-dependent oxidoreductase